MKAKLGFLLFFLLFSALPAFSLIVSDIGFPFKGFVYQGAKIPITDISNVTVTKETPYDWEITYQGKKIKAVLFTFGAIYLTQEGQLPILLSFDIKKYRYNSGTFFLPN